ncbi:MAG: DNA alkylation repair protein [Candidatus Pacebacteria bacterium]|nr:DNA alkylation repair protein [Candidatus Paceibacterota bacterium]
MSNIEDLRKELRTLADFEKANILQRFFKTKKGEYGEGDIFLGIIVPNTRKVAKNYRDLKLLEVKKLLYSKIHEERLCALLILVDKFEKGDDVEKVKVFDFYIKNAKQANNWDLVDLSAPKIVGKYLLDKPKDILYKFAESKNLWEKRISIVSTYTFIKNNQFEDTFKIAEILMNDKHDLIHKAVGWMLREVGKRFLKDEERFLKKYSKKMPRTMLRYAIEKFTESKKLSYLKGLI